MNSARLAVVGILAALFTVLGAGAAQAYPDPTVTINGARLVGGNTFEFSAQSSGVDCAWSVEYLGETKTGSGTSLSGSFGTPPVDEITDTTITATCLYEVSGTANPASATVTSDVAQASPAAFAAAQASASDSATVTLLPLGGDVTPAASGDSGGILPSTGGSSLWILVVGGALVLIGGGAFVVARRR